VTVPLPKPERDLLARHLDELDWLDGKLEKLDRASARTSLDDARMCKLMGIAGISSVIATAVIAAIGNISRFPIPDRLASYFGLTPQARLSGDHVAIHGRISKQRNAVARTMLIEAAWLAASVPGPLRALFLRIKDRKSVNIARSPRRARSRA
jgi:transposase